MTQYVIVNSTVRNKRIKGKAVATMHTHVRDENSEEIGEICLVGQDLTELSLHEYGSAIRKIDLSFNALINLRGLHTCADTLEELILDNNLLEKVEFRAEFPRLHTLSLNKNKISDLDTLIQELSSRVKNLRHLSLHGNPVCPDQLCNDLAEEKDYQLYRCHILYHLRNVQFLDHRSVPLSELKESRRWIYAKMKILPSYTPLPSSSSSHLYSVASGQESAMRKIENEKNTRQNSSNQNPVSNILHESNIEATLSSIGNQAHHHRLGDSMNPTSSSSNSQQRSKGRTGKRRFRYIGKNSEGNRFIKDADL